MVAAFYKELRAILFSRVQRRRRGCTGHASLDGLPDPDQRRAHRQFPDRRRADDLQLVDEPRRCGASAGPRLWPGSALSALFGLLNGLGGFLLAADTDFPPAR